MEPSASSPSNIFSGPEPSRYLALISFARLAAILYYDYLLTFSMEVDYFWKQQRWFSWTSLLFILNRYMAVFGVIPIAMEFFADISSDVALLVIRTYALYNRSKRMLAVLLVVYAIGAVADLVAPWGAMLLFDTTIFVLTLYKNDLLCRTHGGEYRQYINISGLMVDFSYASLVTLSSDLVSRLMLNLRDPKLMRLPQHTQPQPASGTMRSRWNKPQDVELSVVENSSHATSSDFDELSTDILPPTDTTMLP
ncbi:hypothetical protein POSPLADRAFT_1049384 [Postia placenta MAD-698-R-SB12]|uniref:DUF6533 domain-containing protein n=1 Tax=Postia placenta MAD-698-R-SB12 TaxID=670580 RepID=A0A1X6MQI7_9APHY|nr:hypothetical protein POSPLADRAFT_1049384 [Postia placenta MAD-698-R-SB12]OSX58651.1 hypothetical protein POSPLADRAFT_1049384 [Postia placenta MAD-698-R-SB12]